MALEMEHNVEYKKVGRYLVSDTLFLDLIFNNSCNCNCPFCIANTKTFASENYELWKINLQKTLEIFDVRDIIILGGEATVDPLFFDKLDYLKKVIKDKKIDNVILTTNGILLKNKKFLNKVLDSVITTINLSYMNYNHDKNNNIMQGKTLTKDQIKEIYKQVKDKNKTMRINVNVFKDNCDNVDELTKFVEYFNGCVDTIKFSPLMPTDMFDTKDKVTKYTNQVCLTKEEIKKLYDEFVNKHELINSNDSVFGLIPYKELKVNNQSVILKYLQVEDTYDLDKVIPTLKLYSNGNLSNEWDYKKNILNSIKEDMITYKNKKVEKKF